MPAVLSPTLEVDPAQVLHVVPEHVELVHVQERRVEQFFELDILTKLEIPSGCVMLYFVVSEMVFKMSLHVTKVFEQIVKVFKKVLEVEIAMFETAIPVK